MDCSICGYPATRMFQNDMYCTLCLATVLYNQENPMTDIPAHYRKFVESKITDYKAARENLKDRNVMHLLHLTDGICTEAGELKDAIRPYWYKSHQVDELNVTEELGDLMFYIVALMNHFNLSLREILEANRRKLDKRYAGRATGHEFTARDLAAEREALSPREDDGDSGL